MNKYIDAEKLNAEIERLDDKYRTIRVEGTTQQAKEADLVVHVLHELSNFIDRIQQEQPEVDLEKELDQWRHEHFAGKRDKHYSGEYLERSSQLDIARHFWNKGYNAKKG